MSQTILFLYGTLKRGQKNHHFLVGQQFLREGWTLPLYRLYSLGWYPGLVLDQEDGLEVHGELWAVDDPTLARLDEYEGVPNWFIRQDIAVRDCFETVQAYVYNQLPPAGAASGAQWPMED